MQVMCSLHEHRKAFLLLVHKVSFGEMHVLSSIQFKVVATDSTWDDETPIIDSKFLPSSVDFVARRSCVSTRFQMKVAELDC